MMQVVVGNANGTPHKVLKIVVRAAVRIVLKYNTVY
jgi:hypothetical protein